MTATIELTGAEWFRITGRGWVAAIHNDPDQIPRIDPSHLLHHHVIIDGKKYYVVGVERQGYSRRNFGLLIRGER